MKADTIGLFIRFISCTPTKKRKNAFMRTSIEIPDLIFREAKSMAAKQGRTLKDLINEALVEKLAVTAPASPAKPWMALFGSAGKDPELAAELRRIDMLVNEEFGQIDEEEWR